MTNHPLVRKLADFLWVRLPRRVFRYSALGGAALADGGYLRAWRAAAAGAPAAAVLLGLALGAFHPGELYSYSLATVALAGLASALGAALGGWTLIGYAVGDLFFARQGEYSRLALSVDGGGLRALAALLLSYLVFAGLLVLAPVVATAVRASVRDALEDRGFQAAPAGGALVLTHLGIAYLWTQSTPFLIRPIWSYFGASPEVPAIEPLQQRGWMVVLVIAVGIVVRLVLEAWAATRLDPFGAPALVGAMRAPRPWWAVVVGRTAFATFMLSGVLGTWWAAAATAAALAGVFFLHVRVLPALPEYVAAVDRIPLVVRAPLVVAGAYGAGSWIVGRAVAGGSQSFTSLIVATLVSLVLVALLLPAPTRAAARELPKEES